jgi:SAM-dependent methyltransferase
MEQTSPPPPAAPAGDDYRLSPDGIWVPPVPVEHRDEEYDPAVLDSLLRMQATHFWYRGRHRFLLAGLRRALAREGLAGRPLRAIDLGGGCGGWVRYLNERAPDLFAELALGDSSASGLVLAAPVVGERVRRYQVDMLRLGWEGRWDVAFALDVLEHIPDAAEAVRQIGRALAPGGLLIVAVPALQFFWSHYDAMLGHQRRYSRADLAAWGGLGGLELVSSRYFMFFLSPLVLLSRFRSPDPKRMSPADVRDYLARAHRPPSAPVNALLSLIFATETPLGLSVPFPWGTSVLGVFRKRTG